MKKEVVKKVRKTNEERGAKKQRKRDKDDVFTVKEVELSPQELSRLEAIESRDREVFEEHELYDLAKKVYNSVKKFSGGKGKVWEDLSDGAKELHLDSVKLIIEGKIEYPAMLHDLWIDRMFDSGWKYGTKFNEETKEHPYIVDFGGLPSEERTRDRYFIKVTKELM